MREELEVHPDNRVIRFLINLMELGTTLSQQSSTNSFFSMEVTDVRSSTSLLSEKKEKFQIEKFMKVFLHEKPLYRIVQSAL